MCSSDLECQLCLAAEAIAACCPEEEADSMEYCPHLAFLKDDRSRKKEWMESTMMVPFEWTEIAVPIMANEILVRCYGENYMTPIKAPAAHNYPFYRTQVEVLIGGDTGEAYPESQNKKAFLDALGTFDEAHRALGNCLSMLERGEGDEKENTATVQSLLADLQEGAIGIGEAIEALKGEGTATVKKLEEYCEGLYRIYRDVEDFVTAEQSQAAAGQTHFRRGIEDINILLSDVKRGISKEIHDDIPEDWHEKLVCPDGSIKKVVIYGISAIEVLAHGIVAMDKLKETAAKYEEKSDRICVMLMLPTGFTEFIDRCGLKLAEVYRDTVSSFAGKEFCICPETNQTDLAISLADAYYGDDCPLMSKCRDAGLPVMIQDYDI